MYRRSAARRREQANSCTPTTEQNPPIQAIAVVTDQNNNSPSSPSKPSISKNASQPLSSPYPPTSENTANELLGIGNPSASYITPTTQPRTEVQMELYYSRKYRQLEREANQCGDEDKESDIPAMPESESDTSSAFTSGKELYWIGLPEEIAELFVGTREALRRALREDRRRRIVHR